MILRGFAEHVTNPDEVARLERLPLQPWGPRLLDWKISALTVLDHGRLAGLLAATDCLATLLQMMSDRASVSSGNSG